MISSNLANALLTPELHPGLSLAIVIPSVLSIIGILFVFCVYAAVFRELGQYSYPKVLYRMAAYMSFAGLLLTIAGIGIAYDLSERLCHPIWVFLRESAFLSSVFWSSYYAYSLMEIITKSYTVEMDSIEKQGLIVAFALPVIISGFFVLIGYHKGLGIGSYLYMEEDQNSEFKYVALFGFLLPVCGAFLLTIYCYIQIAIYLWKDAHWDSEVYRILSELMLFPTALLICCFFPVLNTILIAFFQKKVTVFILLHYIFQQSTGLINALAYGLKYSSYNYIKSQFRSFKRVLQSTHSTNHDPGRKSEDQKFEMYQPLSQSLLSLDSA